MLPKMEDQYNPILDESYTKNNLRKMDDQLWMDIMLNNILPKMDDQYNPILDGYYAK